ncbi:MAG: hypothetical protein HYT42_02005, partial [Candidatus Sungbacteria bacterium]|nr:hypothetical protein [Candidatus Sungbacteria bacterium]
MFVRFKFRMNWSLGAHQSFHRRLVLIIIFFAATLGAVVIRVFSLAIIEHRR